MKETLIALGMFCSLAFFAVSCDPTKNHEETVIIVQGM